VPTVGVYFCNSDIEPGALEETVNVVTFVQQTSAHLADFATISEVQPCLSAPEIFVDGGGDDVR